MRPRTLAVSSALRASAARWHTDEGRPMVPKLKPAGWERVGDATRIVLDPRQSIELRNLVRADDPRLARPRAIIFDVA